MGKAYAVFSIRNQERVPIASLRLLDYFHSTLILSFLIEFIIVLSIHIRFIKYNNPTVWVLMSF